MGMRTFVALLVFLCLLETSRGLPAHDEPFSLTQSDTGMAFEAQLRGDEFRYAYIKDNHTIIKDSNGIWKYAELSNSRWVPSGIRAEQPPPSQQNSQRISHCNNDNHICSLTKRRKLQSLQSPASSVGVLQNLVILIRFADHPLQDIPRPEDFKELFNGVNVSSPVAPTGSIRDFFRVNSFNKLDIQSTIVGWISVEETQAQWANKTSGLTKDLHLKLKQVLQKVEHLNLTLFDRDQDGWIDASVTFITSGHSAEFGGPDAEDKIWSHKWFFDEPYTIKNVTIQNYHISAGRYWRHGNDIARIGVLAHEVVHSFGIDDYYDYDGSGGLGLGNFCLMGNSYGIKMDQLNPPHLSAFVRVKLGWDEQTEIVHDGTFTVAAAETRDSRYPRVFSIKLGFHEGEYLLIENRQPIGWDRNLGKGGLAIYHVDLNNGINDEGYPGQESWPLNGRHYQVALLQADGHYHLERGVNKGDHNDLFVPGTVLKPSYNISLGPFPNTDSYADAVQGTGIQIYNITSIGARMSFSVTFDATSFPFTDTRPTPSPPTAASPKSVLEQWRDKKRAAVSKNTLIYYSSHISGSGQRLKGRNRR